MPCRTHTFLLLFKIYVVSETYDLADYVDIVNGTVWAISWWGPNDTDVTLGCLMAYVHPAFVRRQPRTSTPGILLAMCSSLPVRPT